MTEDDVLFNKAQEDAILKLMEDALTRDEDESSARQLLAAGEPPQLSTAPTSVREYVHALHIEVSRLQDETQRLRDDYDELEAAKDTDWYVESVDADVATFGEEEVNWDGLYAERLRVHALERTLRDAQDVIDALGRRDLDALRASIERLLRQVGELQRPGEEPSS